MSKTQIIIILLVLGVGLLIVNYLIMVPESFIEIKNQKIKVELADTPAKRAQGLSNREHLQQGHGMMFIFDEASKHSFWMKDMKFYIDIIWIHDETIVDIWPNATIPVANDIPSYTPKAEANFVLEVNAGFVTDNQVRLGDKVEINIK